MTTLDTDLTARATGTTKVRMVVDPRGDLLEAAKQCEADVFDARFGDGREILDEWFGTHDEVAAFLSLVDDEDRTVATARVIPPSPLGLKVDESLRDDWGVDPHTVYRAVGLDPATTWDIATISVRPRSESVGVAWTAALLHGLLELTRVNGATAVVAVLDEGARALLARFSVHFHTLPGCATMPYCGSAATTPVYVDLAALRAHQRATAPEAHRLITLGEGLDGVDVLRGEQLRLPRRVLDVRDPVVAPRQAV